MAIADFVGQCGDVTVDQQLQVCGDGCGCVCVLGLRESNCRREFVCGGQCISPVLFATNCGTPPRQVPFFECVAAAFNALLVDNDWLVTARALSGFELYAKFATFGQIERLIPAGMQPTVVAYLNREPCSPGGGVAVSSICIYARTHARTCVYPHT